MVHTTAGQREREEAIGFAKFFALALLLFVLAAATMLYAPKPSSWSL
jgi:hypothetical protein